LNTHAHSDRDVCPRRRRRGAYAAVLSAAAGAALAAAMIPAAPAKADTTDDAIGAAAAADAVPAKVAPTEDAILDKEILTLFNDVHDPSLGTGDVDLTTELLSLLPGGVNGADGIEVETLLASDLYTPALDLVETLLGGGGMAF
jgi:hypothetical protein